MICLPLDPTPSFRERTEAFMARLEGYEGAIPERLRLLSLVSHKIVQMNIEDERQDDLERWGQEPDEAWEPPEEVKEEEKEPVRMLSLITP